MAEISQNVNIEMLEKLPDGTYKRKYPKTRADDGTTFDEHLAESTQQAHLAKNIGLEDTSGNFVATEVEGAMSELFTNVSNGKDLVGGAITDVDDSVVIPAEPTFSDLASAIGSISTGKKWANGTTGNTQTWLNITGLDFTPSLVMYHQIGTSRNLRYAFGIASSSGDIAIHDDVDSKNVYTYTSRTGAQNTYTNNTVVFTLGSVTNLILAPANRTEYKWIAFE